MIADIIFGAFAYIIPTFLLAYFWHLKWFKNWYEQWEYAGQPSPPLGLAAVAVQGVVLSMLVAHVPEAHASNRNTLALIGGLAALHWSIHALAAMAKNQAERNWRYLSVETLYLALQFGIFAVLMTSVVY